MTLFESSIVLVALLLIGNICSCSVTTKETFKLVFGYGSLYGVMGGEQIVQPQSELLPDLDSPHDEAHFWLNGYVNKQNCRIWSDANPQVYVETPLHPEKLTVWCALWAGGILLQKR
ncbi:hypothetical protein TNCV_3708261 [Trichonephila clavipes]|nr:hypothetical protein TNCV_3708261 [Trichonephila clavipes]